MSDSVLNPNIDSDNRPSLETDRCLLRPFLASDAPTVQRLVNDIEIACMTRSIDYPYPEGAAEKWISRHVEYWQSGRCAIFAITVKRSGDLVGAVGLEIDEHDQIAELGYWIDKPQWNRGYATEVSAVVLDFGFKQLGLNRIIAHHMLRNPASGRVLEKIGMQREGTLRKHFRKWGRFYDVAIYGILKDDPGVAR